MQEGIDLETIDSGLRGGALEIVSRLRSAGFQAFWAGGVVRDLILRRQVSDIDIATSALPQQVDTLFAKTITVGKDFGVVIAVIGEQTYEVTTFRGESNYGDGRHPQKVWFSDIQADVHRRDFTVNALFLDPETLKVTDLVEGLADLAKGLIRTVGDAGQRFQEDKLRLLRAVRLAAELDFPIEADTWSAVQRLAEQITQISWERIRDELLKILTGSVPARGLELLEQSHLLQAILPEVAATKGVPQPPQFHPEGDVWTHICLMFQQAGELTSTLALGLLLHDVGKPGTLQLRERIRFDGHAELGAQLARDIGIRLRLSAWQIDRVSALVKDHLRFIHVQQMRPATLKRFLRREGFDEHLELHRLDCLASHGDLSAYRFCRDQLRQLKEEQIRPKPLINGHDLIALGLKPGSIFSEILREVEDHQLDGSLSDRQSALDWVRTNYVVKTPS